MKFLLTIILIALIPVFAAWGGYCYLSMWEWFVEPPYDEPPGPYYRTGDCAAWEGTPQKELPFTTPEEGA